MDAGRKAATAALTMAPGEPAKILAALTLAELKDGPRAEALASELSQRFPNSTLLNNVWLPTIRAKIAISRDNPTHAIKLLQAALPYELGQVPPPILFLYPVYVRGQAYLRAQLAENAAQEFQKILDHRGIAGKEDAASGTQLIDTIRSRDLQIPLIAAKPVKAKIIRAEGVTPITTGGLVSLPRKEWRADFIKELGDFPVGQHDDVCDAFFHAMKAFTTARDFKTPDLSVMPGHLQSEQARLEQETREEMEYENETGIRDLDSARATFPARALVGRWKLVIPAAGSPRVKEPAPGCSIPYFSPRNSRRLGGRAFASSCQTGVLKRIRIR